MMNRLLGAAVTRSYTPVALLWKGFAFASGGPTPTPSPNYALRRLGLSESQAISLAKSVGSVFTHNRTTLLVRSFLENGFSKQQVAQLILEAPEILTWGARKSDLQLQLGYLLAQFSKEDVVGLLSAAPITRLSLRELHAAFGDAKFLWRAHEQAVRETRKVKGLRVETLIRNITILKLLKINDTRIIKFLTQFPMRCGSDRLVAAVLFMKKIHLHQIPLHPDSTVYMNGINALVSVRQPDIDSRIKLINDWGWKGRVFFKAMAKYPQMLTLSDANLESTFRFLVETKGMAAEEFAMYQSILAKGINKTLQPRFLIFDFLNSKGMVSWDLGRARAAMLSYCSDKFRIMYVEYNRATLEEIREEIEKFNKNFL